MESEISLLMANQTLVPPLNALDVKHANDCQASPGKFIYDPFMGTGSMAYVGSPNVPHRAVLIFTKRSGDRQRRSSVHFSSAQTSMDGK